MHAVVHVTCFAGKRSFAKPKPFIPWTRLCSPRFWQNHPLYSGVSERYQHLSIKMQSSSTWSQSWCYQKLKALKDESLKKPAIVCDTILKQRRSCDKARLVWSKQTSTSQIPLSRVVMQLSFCAVQHLPIPMGPKLKTMFFDPKCPKFQHTHMPQVIFVRVTYGAAEGSTKPETVN